MDQRAQANVLQFQQEAPLVVVGENDTLSAGGPESPVDAALISDEKFIAVDRSAILQRLLVRLFEPHEREKAGAVLSYLCALRQARSAKMLDELVEMYDPFNPDDETIDHYKLTEDQRAELLQKLKSKVDVIVKSANFEEIDDERLKEMLNEESKQGLSAEVDLDEYDFHLLYYRGEVTELRTVRNWTTFWLPKDVSVSSYRRLFLALKLKPREARIKELMERENIERKTAEKRVNRARRNLLEGVSEDHLHLKMFRRIARVDLRILFPNARIKFNLFDKLMLWVGSGGSTLFAIVMAVLKFVAAVAISLFFIVITLAGAVGAVVRSVMNFFNTRNRYMMKLAQSLYFHNLASNQSVLALMNDEAEEEDIKEEALAYCFMLKTPGDDPLHEIQQNAEKFLRDEFGLILKFDVEDALHRLERDGLATEVAPHVFRVLDLDQALTSMRRRWEATPLHGEVPAA
jgi:hypothetical protein